MEIWQNNWRPSLPESKKKKTPKTNGSAHSKTRTKSPIKKTTKENEPQKTFNFSDPILVLALDPATYTTGYAILKVMPDKEIKFLKAGHFSVPKGVKYGERMHLLREKVLLLIDKVKPTNLVIEKPFSGKNKLTFLQLAGGYGILTQIAFEKNLPLIAMPPTDAKTHFLGTSRMKGEESKRKIRVILESLYNTTFQIDDESDALSTGITGIEKYLLEGIDEHY